MLLTSAQRDRDTSLQGPHRLVRRAGAAHQDVADSLRPEVAHAPGAADLPLKRLRNLYVTSSTANAYGAIGMHMGGREHGGLHQRQGKVPYFGCVQHWYAACTQRAPCMCSVDVWEAYNGRCYHVAWQSSQPFTHSLIATCLHGFSLTDVRDWQLQATRMLALLAAGAAEAQTRRRC